MPNTAKNFGIKICIKSLNLSGRNGKRKLYIRQDFFKRVFNKLSNDTEVYRLCTCGSPFIDV